MRSYDLRSQAVLGASIALSAACRCGPSAAGPTSGDSMQSDRQLYSAEIRTTYVSSGPFLRLQGPLSGAGSGWFRGAIGKQTVA